MDTYFSLMNSEPNCNHNTTVCQEHINSIPANSLEPNSTLEYSDLSVLELQTLSSKTSDGPCLAARNLPTNVDVAEASVQDCGRERLKKHRSDVAGWVLIPDRWGQEELMKEWVDYSSFNDLLAPSGIVSAREALIGEGSRRSARSRGFTSTIEYYRERC